MFVVGDIITVNNMFGLLKDYDLINFSVEIQ
jgi:hypothetical protein